MRRRGGGRGDEITGEWAGGMGRARETVWAASSHARPYVSVISRDPGIAERGGRRTDSTVFTGKKGCDREERGEKRRGLRREAERREGGEGGKGGMCAAHRAPLAVASGTTGL